MEKIIAKVYEIIKNTENLITFEEQIQRLMYKTFSELLETVFTQLDEAIVEQKKMQGFKYIHKDKKTLYFTFGAVTYWRSLMKDGKGRPVYPLDQYLGLRKYQRFSALVEVKVAEMASGGDYREVADILNEWTALSISHTTVGNILKRVGEAQSKADEEMVAELEESASLPEGKQVEHLMAEADGVFVRSTERKKSMEVHHALTYEGWDTNGTRVTLRRSKVLLTTRSTDTFWSQVQAVTAHRYSLENTQVVTNSDGGAGYTEVRFQEAFSQSCYKVLNQLDTYHIAQALNRTFGVKSEWKNKVKKAINDHDMDTFTLYVDTYESGLEDPKKIQKVKEFRTYITGNWERIFDWREQVEDLPENARNLGAMESYQRHISFRMKKRGMHWSPEGAEAIAKVKQGIHNQTLRDAYLKHQYRSTRKQREVKMTIRMARILYQSTRPSNGAKQGKISLNGSHSSAVGQLVKSIR